MAQTDRTYTEQQCLAPAAPSGSAWCLAGVLEQLEDAVIVIDNSAEKIIFSNPAAKAILASLNIDNGYLPLNDFLQTRGLDLIPGPESSGTLSTIHNNRIIEFSHHRQTGDIVSLQVRDITEKKRLESIAQSVNTMDNLGFIFSGIRHEIGNPLNSIKMTNSVLQKNLKRFSTEDISRYIDRTAIEITRMEYLLKSLKTFSLYEKADCSPHNLKSYLETLLDLTVPDLDKKSIRAISELPPDDIEVNIDPRGLHQAILNIITNAADAVIETENATIGISTRINGRLAWLIIEDNGCGMSKEQLDTLFQPFHTSKAHGNGLGMVITQKLLTMMQATLEISSNLGRGTTVSIGLPLVRPTHDAD